MNALTDNIQVIKNTQGHPAFVVIPYADYIANRDADRTLIPHDVISRTVDGASPIKAWREHLGLTQVGVAERLGISQSAYAQQENSARLRKDTRERIALVLGITDKQLDF